MDRRSFAISFLCACVLFCLAESTGIAESNIRYELETIEGSEFYTYTDMPVKGMLEFTETISRPFDEYWVEIRLKNKSERPLDLRGAGYIARTDRNTFHRLEFEEVQILPEGKNPLVLRQESLAMIRCHSSVKNAGVKEIYIQLKDGRKIHFVPYRSLAAYVTSPGNHAEDLACELEQ